MNMVEEIERRALEELGKRQFKMYLPDELEDQIALAAERYGRRSSQVVIEEVLTIYLPAWSAMQTAMRRATDYHLQNFGQTEILSAGGKKVILLENAGEVVDGVGAIEKKTRRRKAG
jgi:hypothetical protein